MTDSDTQSADLVMGAVRVATRTLGAAQAVTDLAIDVARQAMTATAHLSRSPAPTKVLPARTAPPADLEIGLAPSPEVIQELDDFLAGRPYWEIADRVEAARRRLRLGILIGEASVRAGRQLAVHELVGLAYQLERTRFSPKPALPAGQ
jgi:hypothetical protein